MNTKTFTGALISYALLSLLLSSCSSGWDFPQDMPGQPDGDMDPSQIDYSGGTDSEVVYDGTVKEYDGQKAADSSLDVVDKNNADIYWEANSFTTNVSVVYNGTSATVNNPCSDVLCYRDGANVTIDLLTNSVSGVNIVVSGVSTDGSLKIYGDKKLKLTLKGLELTSTKGPAINSQCHKRMFVYLEEGTTNTLCDAQTYSADSKYLSDGTVDTEDRKGCLFSEGNLIFSGTGVLVVNGKHQHGICTDGCFWMRPGTTIIVNEAVKNCIHVKGDTDDAIGVHIDGGYVYANASGQAGKCIKCDMDVKINGGTFVLNTSGNAYYDSTENDTSSSSCIKSDTDITITGGTFSCKSVGTAGKGLKADGNMTFGVSGTGTGPVMTIATTGSSYGSSASRAGGFGPGGNPWGGGGQSGNNSSGNTSKAKTIKADGTITFYGGTYTVTTATSGSEGIESKSSTASSINFKGGDIYLKCYDDCINSSGAILFSGARVYAWSTGNDSVDSNYGKTGAITISDGVLLALSSKGAPEEGIDADNASLAVSGGYIFSMGASQSSVPSVPTSSTATQPTACLRNMALSSGQYCTVFDSSDNAIFTLAVPFSISQNYSVVSCPAFKKGETYYVKTGSESPSGFTSEWNGFYIGGKSSASTTKKTVKFSSNYVAV